MSIAEEDSSKAAHWSCMPGSQRRRIASYRTPHGDPPASEPQSGSGRPAREPGAGGYRTDLFALRIDDGAEYQDRRQAYRPFVSEHCD
jgi:hypothetical protein